jgi:hypothetical protein
MNQCVLEWTPSSDSCPTSAPLHETMSETISPRRRGEKITRFQEPILKYSITAITSVNTSYYGTGSETRTRAKNCRIPQSFFEPKSNNDHTCIAVSNGSRRLFPSSDAHHRKMTRSSSLALSLISSCLSLLNSNDRALLRDLRATGHERGSGITFIHVVDIRTGSCARMRKKRVARDKAHLYSTL